MLNVFMLLFVFLARIAQLSLTFFTYSLIILGHNYLGTNQFVYL